MASLKHKINFLWVGVILPTMVLWAVYFFIIRTFVEPYDVAFISTRYYHWFFSGKFHYSDLDFVVIGDSSARAAINPTVMSSISGTNLSLNHGIALTAYETLRRMDSLDKKPRCALYVSQYNWELNYPAFFSWMIRSRFFSFDEALELYRETRRAGVFPGAVLSWPHFILRLIRSLGEVESFPLDSIDRTIVFGRHKNRPTNAFSRRGWLAHGSDNSADDNRFFLEQLKEVLSQPFAPNPSEDFYIRKFVDLAHTKNIRPILLILPVAESDSTPKYLAHLTARNNHVRSLFAGKGSEIPMPLTMKREWFFDFNHFNEVGAEHLSRQIEDAIRKECHASI